MSASLVILLCVSSTASLAQAPDTAVINNFISKQASRERGDEYEDARKVITGDLNWDGKPDLAVLYTIEGQNGTNNYRQYLAVFVRVKERVVAAAHAAVGGKLYRAVDLQSISRNEVLLSTLSYAPLDASCCPSKKGKARYVLVKGRLKQR